VQGAVLGALVGMSCVLSKFCVPLRRAGPSNGQSKGRCTGRRVTAVARDAGWYFKIDDIGSLNCRLS
jgi:hypothetical protein